MPDKELESGSYAEEDSSFGAVEALKYARGPSIFSAPREPQEYEGETEPLIKGKDSSTKQCNAVSEFFQTLKTAYGWQLLVVLFSAQTLLKGFTNGLVGKGTPYLFRLNNIPAPQVQVYQGIIALPWAMKPVLGLLSDIVPIMGYGKGPYMLIASMMGLASLLIISAVPTMSIRVTIVCLVFVANQISSCDLLSEAVYTVKMQANPSAGPSLMTFVWGGINCGSMAAVFFSGPIIEAFGVRAVFLICAMPAATILLPLVMGYLEEKTFTTEEVAEIRARYFAQKEVCGLCVLMLAGTLTIMIVGLLQHDPYVNCFVAISVGVIMLCAFTLVLTPVIAKFNMFSVLTTSLMISTSGASFYFYTNTPEMYPEGPHFSTFFYNTVMGVTGTTFSLLGIYCYQAYLSDTTFRTLIVTTSCVVSVTSLLDVLMFARLNVKLGIPDHVLVLGSASVESLISVWTWMPQVVLFSKLCPSGMSATMFALLAGCHNLGMSISSAVGSALLHWLHVRPKGAVGESAEFANLWKASLIATVLPVVAAVLLMHLVPNAKQTDALDIIEDATEGSLLRRWLSSSR